MMQVFSLSVTEIGNLVSLGPRESCEFFHDPFKGKGYDLGSYEIFFITQIVFLFGVLIRNRCCVMFVVAVMKVK